MSQAAQALVPVEAELLKQEQEAQLAVAAVNPATIAAFVQIGVSLLSFAATLFGGKTGAALNEIASTINGLNMQLLTIANDTQKMLAQIEETINSIDQQELSKLSPVHSQIMAYMGAFPNGAPDLADTNNLNYALANQTTGSSVAYFQNINRGPITFMPILCHATNSRMELAISTWACWWNQNSPAQPFFNQELNTSSGKLSSNIFFARKHVGKDIFIKVLKSSGRSVARDTPIDHDPPSPPETIGYQVKEGGTVLWEKMDPGAYGEALNRKAGFKRQRENEKLAGYIGTLDRWANMSARLAPAGIERALNLGDAKTFMRYVNPSALVMEEPEENARALGLDGSGPVYRALPMRDILLDILTSDTMRARHGLLVKGADKRAVNTWFEKTFFRKPSPAELGALVQVAELFGNDAFFGCLAYSDEYKTRFGDGIPGPVDRPKSAPAPGPVTKA
ncbi:MAG: hypothetical protein ACRD7E_21435 [Bryobacteraceae bacterium]